MVRSIAVLHERSEHSEHSYYTGFYMDRMTGIFVDGIGAGAAPSGILTQLQGRIFALLYLEPTPMSLDDIAAELQQSKCNISASLHRRVAVPLVRRSPGYR